MLPIPVPLSAKMLSNVDEASLNNENARLENCYINDVGAVSNFPSLVEYVDIPGDLPTILYPWKGDLIGVSGGRVYRIDPNNAAYTDVTGAYVSGSGRPIFADTGDDLLMAAGGAIARLRGSNTEQLSKEAPDSTHVAYVDGYVIAIENRSGRFQHTSPGVYTAWNPLDIFSAEGKPDNINAAIISEFGELMMAGVDSIEQFDPAPNGTRPFFKRWGLSSGIYAPYTLVAADNRLWGVNKEREFVAYASQSGAIASGDIQSSLSKIDNWKDAWAQELLIDENRFIVLQMPYATNIYETEGVTLLLDYRRGRWYNLYGWDSNKELPTRWPGWSFAQIGEKRFVGGNGKIYTLGGNAGLYQRHLWRSGHITVRGNYQFRVNEMRIRMKRGTMDSNSTRDDIIALRINKDNRGFSRKMQHSLGKYGERDMIIRFPGLGIADTWQFQIESAGTSKLEIKNVDLEVDVLK